MSEEINNSETGKEEPVPAEEIKREPAPEEAPAEGNKEEKPQTETADDSTQGTSSEESKPAESEDKGEIPEAAETAAGEEKAEAANPNADAANPVDSAEEVKQEQKPAFDIKELLRKKWLWAIAAAIILLIILCATHVICISHDYLPATCTEPAICRYCGKTEGEALGHDWKAATCTEPETCTLCGETQGEALGHQWKAATCIAPKTCFVCGETEGEPLGHKCSPATCTEDSVCSVCGETVQKALGHDWAAATEEAPKTCRRCGITEGEPLGPQDYGMTPSQYISKFNSLSTSSTLRLSSNTSTDDCYVLVSGKQCGINFQFCNWRKGLDGSTTGAGLSYSGFDTVYAYYMCDDSYVDTETMSAMTVIGMSMAEALGWKFDVNTFIDDCYVSNSGSRYSYSVGENLLVVEFRTTSYSSVYDVYVTKS